MRKSYAVGFLTAALIIGPVFPVRSHGNPRTVRGYVLDSACAFIKNLEKPVSTECALSCAKAGSPLVDSGR